MSLIDVFLAFLGLLAGFRFWPIAIYVAAAVTGLPPASQAATRSKEALEVKTSRTVLGTAIVWLTVFSAIGYLVSHAAAHRVAWVSLFGGVAFAPCFAVANYFVVLRRIRATSSAGTASSKALRRATPLQDGSGYLLVHSKLQKGFVWIILLEAMIVLGVGLYAPINGAGFLANIITVPAAGALGWIFLWMYRLTRNQVEVSDRGIGQRRGAFYLFLPWSDVSSIRESPFPTSVIFRSARGQEVRVDKRLVGLSTLLEYAQSHLSPQLYFAALSYLRPETALALRTGAAPLWWTGSCLITLFVLDRISIESSPFGREAVTQSGRPKAGQKSLSAGGTELAVSNASMSKFFGFSEDPGKSGRITGLISRDLEGPATLRLPGKRRLRCLKSHGWAASRCNARRS